MIFHYQKHTVLNYWWLHRLKRNSPLEGPEETPTPALRRSSFGAARNPRRTQGRCAGQSFPWRRDCKESFIWWCTVICFMSPLSPPLTYPPPPLPTPRICRNACGHVIRISWRRETPPPHTPQQDYSQILATSLKVEDGLHLGVCECSSWIWTATVIMYEFSVQ
jgi:hypothetical protein